MQFKSAIFTIFKKLSKIVWGIGLGKIPGALRVYDFLFLCFWPKTSVIEVQGSKMHVDLNREFMLRKTFESYIMAPDWEALMTQMFKKMVKEGNTVLDLGANLGYYTLLAAKLVGKSGKVFSFEPEPRNYNLLTTNVNLNNYTHVTPIQKAISNKSARMKLFIDDQDSGAHTIRNVNAKKKSMEIETVALDDYFKGKEKTINVIKMDIEGAEMLAFSGMNNIIRESNNLKIFVEFYPLAIKESGVTLEQFINRLLNEYGFSILAIDDYKRTGQYVKINSAEEIIKLCKGERIMNLLLEKNNPASLAQ